MGRKLFDFAFREYAQRWMFKHPTPEDLFRTMEDASAVDLDWFWRGWFYTTDYVDISLDGVTKYTKTSGNSADCNTENNLWPPKMKQNRFDLYKGSSSRRGSSSNPMQDQ